MWKTNPTLSRRVTLWLTSFSLGLFLIVGFVTFMVTLGSEDAMLHNILRTASQNERKLQGAVKEMSFQQLIDFGYEGASAQDFSKRVNAFGEFPKNDRYYHFMILQDKILLMDTTDLVSSTDRLEGILALQLKILVPFLVMVFFISRLIAIRSLRPFSLLKDELLKPERSALDIKKLNEQIKETDIKQIADELAKSLAQKEHVLEQQITFNQGMSHELRTPLQIMRHASELMSMKYPDLKDQQVYQRLTHSVERMHRIGEALLWLTSNVDCNQQVQVNLNLARLKVDIEQSFDGHGLHILMVEKDKLSLPIPNTVFEFIVFNLATNAVHHGKDENGEKALQIEITQDSLIFSNPTEERIVDNNETQTNFGIGLSLVEKLCTRFNILATFESGDDQFIVTLYLNH